MTIKFGEKTDVTISSGTNRILFDDTGAIGLRGANYGNIGDVITNGTNGLPTWAAPSAGGYGQNDLGNANASLGAITIGNKEILLNENSQIARGTSGSLIASVSDIPTTLTNLHFGGQLTQDSAALSNGRHVLKDFDFLNMNLSTVSSPVILDANGVFTAPVPCVVFVTYQVLVRDDVPSQNVNELSLYLQKGDSSGGAFSDVRFETVQLGSTGDTYIQHSLSLSSILTLAQNERFRCEVEVYSSGGDAILKAFGTSMSCLGFEIPNPISNTIQYGIFSQANDINPATKNAFADLTTLSTIQANGISMSTNGIVTLPSRGLYLCTGTIYFGSQGFPSINTVEAQIVDNNGNVIAQFKFYDTPTNDHLLNISLPFSKAIVCADTSVTYKLQYNGTIRGTPNQLIIGGGNNTTNWNWIKLTDSFDNGLVGSTYGVFYQQNNVTQTPNSFNTLATLSPLTNKGITYAPSTVNGTITLPSTGLYFFLGTIQMNATSAFSMMNYQVQTRDSAGNTHSINIFNDAPDGATTDTLSVASVPFCGAVVHTNPSVTYYTEFRANFSLSDTLVLKPTTETTWFKIGDPGGITTYAFFRLNGWINPATRNAYATLTTFSTVQANGISMSNGVITLPSTGVYYYTGYIYLDSRTPDAQHRMEARVIDNNNNVVSSHVFVEDPTTDILNVATQTFTNVIHCTNTSVTYRLQYRCDVNGTSTVAIGGNEYTQMIWLKIA